MQYEKEQPLDPPEYHDRPEREYDADTTDRFEAQATEPSPGQESGEAPIRDAIEYIDANHPDHAAQAHALGGNLANCPGCDAERVKCNLRALLDSRPAESAKEEGR